MLWMEMVMNRRLLIYACFLMTGICLSGGIGCTDKGSKSQKVKKVSGIAKKVDLTNNRVSMGFRNEKGIEQILEGTVREDTEVEINGRKQKLEDIHEGDKVDVYGIKEGRGESLKLVATRIVATRPQAADWKSTNPTTQKTGGTAPTNTAKPASPAANPGGAAAKKP
jgi:hypothetical protein